MCLRNAIHVKQLLYSVLYTLHYLAEGAERLGICMSVTKCVHIWWVAYVSPARWCCLGKCVSLNVRTPKEIQKGKGGMNIMDAKLNKTRRMHIRNPIKVNRWWHNLICVCVCAGALRVLLDNQCT